ncbi:GGDEF domain-containing protein [Modicisalibacter luteus]|uniref:GGDEF domain-containing protein n=1 Tax=Modicisalibacter luteus TaxID=453962 RepID=UPI0036310888
MALSLLNLACIAANIVAIVLHRHGQCPQALLTKLVSATTLIIATGMALGDETGCEYFFFVLLFEVLISDLARRLKLLLSLLVISLILATEHLLFGTLGNWPYSSLSRELLYSLNVVVTFVLFTFIVLQVYAITETTERRFRIDATHDSLTGVLNRRAIFEKSERYWQAGHPFALLLLDADHFKFINDNHGHSVGDEVLRHLAQLLGRTLREADFIGRVGGEEFLVLLPDTSREEALGVATRLRNTLSGSPCRLESLDLAVTVSMGLALSSEGDKLRDVVDLADRRLYLAKSSGRDRLFAQGANPGRPNWVRGSRRACYMKRHRRTMPETGSLIEGRYERKEHSLRQRAWTQLVSGIVCVSTGWVWVFPTGHGRGASCACGRLPSGGRALGTNLDWDGRVVEGRAQGIFLIVTER